MNDSVKNFYKKNRNENYRENYDNDHGSRIDFVIEKFDLQHIKNKKILDIGCGLGNFFKRLDNSNSFYGIDGAIIKKEDKLCDFELYQVDLNRPFADKIPEKDFDICICSELLEHLTDDYTCLVEIKKLVKQDGDIIITIPAYDCWHNWIRPGHMHPKENYEVFLGQLALDIQEYFYWADGWQCHCWKMINKEWKHSKMVFPKNESKFIGKTPLEMVNL